VDLQRIVLAYSGSLASSAAVRWLIETYGAEVVTVTVDVGQTDDLEEVYARALACGATRAHVVDRCEVFARNTVLPAVARPEPLDDEALRHLAYPVLASALLDIAKIERADAVAHAAMHESLDAHIHRLDAALPVIAAAREWGAQGIDPSDYAKMHHVSSSGTIRAERHLLLRPLAGTGRRATDEGADVTIGFADGRPASVNGVAMELEELIESLSLIGGQYGLSASTATPAPAAVLLQAAYRESAGRTSVTLRLKPNVLDVFDGDELRPPLVNRS
jgi:argininosuccinate synthase